MADVGKMSLPKTDAFLAKLKAEKGENYLSMCYMFLKLVGPLVGKKDATQADREDAARKMSVVAVLMGMQGTEPDEIAKDAMELAELGMREIAETGQAKP